MPVKSSKYRLSFIIPFYNGGAYLGECLDSLLAQDISIGDYEIIIIDDCSTDEQSLDILSRYECQYSNISVLHNKSNLRAGGCRNIGVIKAHGDYVWFIDQDDFIKPNCLNGLLQICKQEKLDILYFDYSVLINHSFKKKSLTHDDSTVMTGLEYICSLCHSDFWNSEYDTNVWHSIFRREWLINNKIFSPIVSYCEDMIVSIHAIIVAKRFKSLMNDYYYYRINEDSVFHTEVGVNGRAVFDGSIQAGKYLMDLSCLVPENYSNLKSVVYSGGLNRFNSFTKQLLKISSGQRRLFYDCLNSNWDDISLRYNDFSSRNQWLIRHQKIALLFPHCIYYVIVILERIKGIIRKDI